MSLCPYLGCRDAGAEPHPYASSHNVCVARPGRDERSYVAVSHETQIRCCLEPVEGWPACRTFLAAVQQGVPPLRTPATPVAHSRRRRRRSVSRRPSHRLARMLPRVVPALAILVVSILLGILVARTVNRLW